MASKRRQRRVMCEGKVRHPSHGRALAAAKATGNPLARTWLEPYRCPFCGGWHVGHRPGKQRGS